MTLQIEEKERRKAIITRREGKEKERHHDYMERDKGGGGGGGAVQPSLSPEFHQKCSSTVTHDDWTTARVFQLTARTRWHVQLFIFGYLQRSLRYPRVDAAPESAGRCAGLFWEAGYHVFVLFFSPGISGVASGEPFM